MPDVVKFLRQLGHDLRNHLNAAELQSAYVAELAEDPERKDEIKRLRATISEMGASLERVTSGLGAAKLTLMPYSAADLVEDLGQKLATDYPNEQREDRMERTRGRRHFADRSAIIAAGADRTICERVPARSCGRLHFGRGAD